MNRKVRKTFIGAFLATSLFMGVNSVSAVTIKETIDAENETLDKIADNTTIIGATKFEPNVVLTAMRIAKAATNDVYLNLDNPDYNGVKIYNYLFGDWYVLDEDNNTRVLGQDEEYQKEDEITLNKLKEQAIYYVNNEEKVLDIEYSKDLDAGYTLEFRDGDKKLDLEYTEDGIIKVPATVQNVEIYAVKKNGEETVETKLDEFSKTSMDASEFKTISSLGSITYGDVTASNITIDKIEWTQAKGESASGYYATVTINVPEVYKNDYSGATYYIDDNEKEPVKLTEEALSQKLTFDKDHDSHKITVIWAEGNTQVFTVKVEEFGAAFGGTISYGKDSSTSELNIGTVEWSNSSETIANGTAGYYATVTIKTEDYIGANLNQDTNATYYIDELAQGVRATQITDVETVINLKFDAKNLSHTITVEWEKGNIQVFKVTANGLATIPAGTIAKDEDTLTKNFTFDSKTNTATISGDIKWYQTGETADYGSKTAEAGNFKSVIITAPDEFSKYTNVSVVVDENPTPIAWNVSENGKNINLELNFTNKTSHTIKVTWEEGNIQEFIVKLDENAVLEKAIAGTITYNETTDASKITIDEVKWYNSSETIAKGTAGNYATVTINVPTEYQVSKGSATIEKTLTFAKAESKTISIEWEKGNIQVFTVEAKSLEAAPAGTIATEDLTLANGKLSGTVKYVKDRGNVISYVITAPDAYTDDDSSAEATITITSYGKDETVTNLKDKESVTFNSSNKTYGFTRIVNDNFAYDEITIVWENGNTQVIKVVADNLKLEAKPNYIKTLEIDETTNAIIVGNDLQLSVTKTAEDDSKDITKPEVEWTSSDKNVATVDAEGKVTAVGFGSATITVSAKDGSGVTDTFEITVKYAPIVDNTTCYKQGVDNKKIVTINFAAEGGADKNNFVTNEDKAFTYTYTIEKDGVTVSDPDLATLASYKDNVLTLTVTDDAKYEVKYSISQVVTYADSQTTTVELKGLSKVVLERKVGME